jgi:hypothetical protein
LLESAVSCSVIVSTGALTGTEATGTEATGVETGVLTGALVGVETGTELVGAGVA